MKKKQVTLKEALRLVEQGCTCLIQAGREGYELFPRKDCKIHGEKKEEE